jgi:agmatinase
VCEILSAGSNLTFHVSAPAPFSGFSKPFGDVRYVVVGVPYDMTSSYRSGSRFGPAALREASLNIETYSLRSNIDLEDIGMVDLGDVHVVSNPSDIVERVRLVVKDVLEAGKVPILLGGEHLITLGAIKALQNDVAIIDFDAHLDLRETYMGEEYSHATFMRKVVEILPRNNIFYVGTRAISKDELEFSKAQGLGVMDVSELRKLDSNEAADNLKSKLAGFGRIYLTVDVDVFDPAYAPAVGNPEADGLSPDMVLTLISQLCDHRIVGLDLVEVTPHYDTGITAALGARTIFEAVCAIEKSTRTVGT